MNRKYLPWFMINCAFFVSLIAWAARALEWSVIPAVGAILLWGAAIMWQMVIGMRRQ